MQKLLQLLTNINLKTRMAKDNKPNQNKIKFNPFWIYGGVLALIILWNIFSKGVNYSEPIKISSAKFNTLLDKGEVQKVIVFDKTQAEVYLTSEALKDATNKKLKKTYLTDLTKDHITL